jgi:hypothetical protein
MKESAKNTAKEYLKHKAIDYAGQGIKYGANHVKNKII